MAPIHTHLFRSSAHVSIELRELVKNELAMIGIGCCLE
jgi:hypothetical protein